MIHLLAEILLKLALNTNHASIQLINQSTIACWVSSMYKAFLLLVYVLQVLL
jgi:hypothetical protein